MREARSAALRLPSALDTATLLNGYGERKDSLRGRSSRGVSAGSTGAGPA